jgi:hypothetical protein
MSHGASVLGLLSLCTVHCPLIVRVHSSSAFQPSIFIVLCARSGERENTSGEWVCSLDVAAGGGKNLSSS